MDNLPQSKGAQHIAELMQGLPPESERYQVLASAKRFKSSWVELGESLARVSNSGEYAEWGYASFEDYCAKEVRIRRQTAEKLLLAFRFMERKEPRLLEKRAERPLPDYRSIDLLRQADEEQQFSREHYADLRKTIVEEERSHPTAARQYRDLVQAYQPEQQDTRRCKSAIAAARRLATSLADLDGVPGDLRDAVEQLIGHLEGRMDE